MHFGRYIYTMTKINNYNKKTLKAKYETKKVIIEVNKDVKTINGAFH